MDGQGTTWRRNIAKNFNRLSRVHQRYRRQTTDRQTTDGPSMTNSEHELEFTFAKNYSNIKGIFFTNSETPTTLEIKSAQQVTPTLLHFTNSRAFFLPF